MDLWCNAKGKPIHMDLFFKIVSLAQQIVHFVYAITKSQTVTNNIIYSINRHFRVINSKFILHYFTGCLQD